VINIKNISFPVDDELYIKIKIISIKANKTLKDYMIQLIKKAIEEQEEQDKQK